MVHGEPDGAYIALLAAGLLREPLLQFNGSGMKLLLSNCNRAFCVAEKHSLCSEAMSKGLQVQVVFWTRSAVMCATQMYKDASRAEGSSRCRAEQPMEGQAQCLWAAEPRPARSHRMGIWSRSSVSSNDPDDCCFLPGRSSSAMPRARVTLPSTTC